MTLVYNRSIERRTQLDLKLQLAKDKSSEEVLKYINQLIKNSKAYPINNPNKGDIDLVYIVRPGEVNLDLRYSLRSVSKFCKFRNIWIVGFKPTWVQNVKYIPTNQNKDKWQNSLLNYKTACECTDISDNFVLMNDDFFAIRPVTDWEHDCNVCLGKLYEFVDKFSNIENKSKWQWGFTYATQILQSFNSKTSFNYEAHTPIILNRHNYLAMLRLPDINSFLETKKCFHKRSVYKNLYDNSIEPRRIDDVKLNLYKDLDLNHLHENWISTYDDTLGNKSYPLINKLLLDMLDKPCRYEKIV